MRSAVLILSLLVVLGGVFYFVILADRPDAYVTEDGATRPTSAPLAIRAAPPATQAGNGDAPPIGSSENVAFEQIDERGRITRFNFDRLDPRDDDAVDVTRPRIAFLNVDGSVVTLEGTRGTIVYSQAGGRADPQSMGSAKPTSGILENVTIRLLDHEDDAEPALVATLPRVQFDGIDNRVSTIDSVIDGRAVLAEQVPVTVRGRDFEFDGRGLVMRWNDRDGRLEQLTIRRGERLLVRDISRFGGDQDLFANAPPRPAMFGVMPMMMGIVMVDAPMTQPTRQSRAARRRAEEARLAASTRPAKVPVLYHVRFEEAVNVRRGGATVATADSMRLVLSLDGNDRTPATRPATTRRSRTTTTRATRSGDAPHADSLEIRWTGPLEVRPADETVMPARGGKMVEFLGTPARVSQGDSTIEARLIHIEPDAGLARIEPGGPVMSIQLTAGNNLTLRSRSPLLIDRAAGVATIEGGGTMIGASPEAQGQTTSAIWSKRFSLQFGTAEEDTSENPWLQRLELEGAASVESDTFTMRGDAIAFGFDRPAQDKSSASLAAPDVKSLRLAEVAGNAQIEIGSLAERRTLSADHISLGLQPHGDSIALASVLCDGDVGMLDAAGATFTSSHLDIALRPVSLTGATTRPTTDRASATTALSIDIVERLNATGDVRMTQPDGAIAEAATLRIESVDATQRVILSGTPATLRDSGTAVTGDRIEFAPASGDAKIVGPGTIATTAAVDRPAASRVTWVEGLAFTNSTSQIAIQGQVEIDHNDPQGSTTHATADGVNVTLRQIDQNAATPASRPTSTLMTSMPSATTVDLVQLKGNVRAISTTAPGREARLETEELDVDFAGNLVLAPREGRLLMSERSASTSQPAATTTRPAVKEAASTSLAVRWLQQLRWDLAAGTFTLDGGVRMGYERAGLDDLIQVNAGKLVATLTPVDLSQSAPASGAGQPAVELKKLRILDDVGVRSRRARFDAAILEYNVATDQAFASGNGQRDVTVYNANGASSVGFSQITWNVATGAIEDFRDTRGRVRQ